MYAKNYLILFEFAAVIVCHKKILHIDTHTHLSLIHIFRMFCKSMAVSSLWLGKLGTKTIGLKGPAVLNVCIIIFYR